MKAPAIILAIGSLVFLFLTVHQNIRLTQDGFYDNTNFWTIQGEFYRYSDIDRLQFREKTPNGYGDFRNVPSYVILLKSRKAIDPIHLDTMDKNFSDAFRKNGVFVEGP